MIHIIYVKKIPDVIANRRGLAKQVFAFYHGRGKCEKRIEELQNGFAADGLSCHRFLANAFRLLLPATAYNLVVLFRHHLPECLQHAQIETLRRQGAFLRCTIRLRK